MMMVAKRNNVGVGVGGVFRRSPYMMMLLPLVPVHSLVMFPDNDGLIDPSCEFQCVISQMKEKTFFDHIFNSYK